MLVAATVALSMSVTSARAAGIADSDLGKGFTRLLKDATAFVGIAGCAIAILAAMAFLAARSFADPQDGPMWTKRAKVAGICAILIPLVASIINLLASYF